MNRNHVVITFICLMSCRGAFALEMPSEIPNVFLGMTLNDLVASRPNLKWTTIDGEKKIEPDKLVTGSFAFSERLTLKSVFHSATYGVLNGKVVTISLMSDLELRHERDVRKRIIKQCIDRWGKAHKKRIPEDARRPGNPRPVLIWEINDTEITLMLPQNRQKGDSKPNGASMHFRLIPIVNKFSWKEIKLSDAERKTLFESHDVLE